MLRVTTTEGNFLKENVPYMITEIEIDLFDVRKIGTIVSARPKYFAIIDGVRVGKVNVDGMGNSYEISAVLVEGYEPSEDLEELALALHVHMKERMEVYSTAKSLFWTITIE